MSVLNETARQLIESGAPAHFVTLGKGGSPQMSMVWVGLDGDEIVMAHLEEYQKVRNIRRDPRVALSIATGRLNAIGMEEHLIVYGTACITEGGAPELLQRLAFTYVGPDVVFPPMDDPPRGYLTRITPERVSGMGDWR